MFQNPSPIVSPLNNQKVKMKRRSTVFDQIGNFFNAEDIFPGLEKSDNSSDTPSGEEFEN